MVYTDRTKSTIRAVRYTYTETLKWNTYNEGREVAPPETAVGMLHFYDKDDNEVGTFKTWDRVMKVEETETVEVKSGDSDVVARLERVLPPVNRGY